MEAMKQSVGQGAVYYPHILLVDDEPNLGKGLQMVLSDEGYSVDFTMTGRSALDTFRRRDYDLVVADLRLPDIDGMEIVKQVKGKRPETEVIVITGYSTVSSAVNAMKIGAYDYLPKPFTTDEFMNSVHGALKQRKEGVLARLVGTEEGRLIERREVLWVLELAAQDETFWRDLLDRGSEALEGLQLSGEAKTAIVSGDLRWIREHVGELNEKQLLWIHARLALERW